MKRRYVWGLILLALTGILVGGFGYWRGNAPAPATCTAQRLPVGVTLSERGVLSNQESVPVELTTSGEIMEMAKSGTRVKKGDIVVRIDTSEQAERLEEQLLEVESAKMDRQAAQAEMALAKLRDANERAVLEKQLAVAKLEEATARQGLTPQERRQLVIKQELAKLELEDAQEELARQKRLCEKGFISPTLLETYERQSAVAQARLEEADNELALREQGRPAEELLELGRAVQRYEALLARAARANERKLEHIANNLKIAQTRLAELDYETTNLRQELAGAALAAPADGVLRVNLYRDWRSGDQWVEYKPGVKKWERDRVATIVNPGLMKVDIMLHEADINLVRAGRPARLRLSAYPDRTFAGRILDVGGVGRDRADVAPRGYDSGGKTDVTMFNCTVSLAAEGVELRPGMSVMVEIEILPEAPRLVLPREAVTAEGGRFTVQRLGLLQPAPVELQGRYLNDAYFEVTSGLAAGDTVLIPRQEAANES